MFLDDTEFHYEHFHAHLSVTDVIFPPPIVHLESTYFRGKTTYLTCLAREAQNIGRFSINLGDSCQGGSGVSWGPE